MYGYIKIPDYASLRSYSYFMYVGGGALPCKLFSSTLRLINEFGERSLSFEKTKLSF
jgi:hypothetical protein